MDDPRGSPSWVDTVRQATQVPWSVARTERIVAQASARAHGRRTYQLLQPAAALVGLMLLAGAAVAGISHMVQRTRARNPQTATTQKQAAPAARLAIPQGQVVAPAEVQGPGAASSAISAPLPNLAPTAREPVAFDRKTRDWKRLAHSGRHAEAFEALQADRARGLDDSPESLLLAADAARLSRHPHEARAWLERLVRRHPRDARVPVAQFTLGRVLLDELGRPREAAKAFARANQAGGPLAPDALAREVEAWAVAGEADRARARAQRYLELYPAGEHASFVRRSGRL